jgi:murein DD-endopeptidase MepM/ murein hydrolase activator NlpD
VILSKQKYGKLAVVPGGKISSPYLKHRGTRDPDSPGYEKHGKDIIHQGIDIKARTGTPIRAVSDGEIFAKWPDGKVSGYGNTIILKHDDNRGSLYAHMNSFGKYNKGDRVNQGDIIGYVGQTQLPRDPMKTAPHLHLEVFEYATTHINASHPPRLDPVKYIGREGMAIG